MMPCVQSFFIAFFSPGQIFHSQLQKQTLSSPNQFIWEEIFPPHFGASQP
jgi:hypothetical protein